MSATVSLFSTIKHVSKTNFTKALSYRSSWQANNMSTSIKTNSYYMPAEHDTQHRTLMAFPSLLSANNDVEYLKAMRSEVVSIANTIAKFQPVHLFSAEESIPEAQKMVDQGITVSPATVNELWMRDSSPAFIRERATGKLAALDLNFSYWGGKLPRAGDENVARQIAEHYGLPRIQLPLIVEGGGIEVDGEGTFMGTESSIINDNRNPGKSKSDIEEVLRPLLGVEKFIWIPGLRDFDVTDDHVDALARFVKPGVVVVSEPGAGAANLKRENFDTTMKILSECTDAKGRRLQIHTCKEAGLKYFPGYEEENLVASYVNYLLVNGGLIISKFGDPETDDEALQLFQRLFPDRKCVQVSINALPRTGGGIHCATHQIPAFDP